MGIFFLMGNSNCLSFHPQEYNLHFLQKNKEKYSLGGTNNLNVSWSDDKWLQYFETHKGNYQELNLNLDL